MAGLPTGAKGKDAKQKSWTNKQTMHVRSFSKAGGKKKVGQGKEKKEVSNRQDKKKSQTITASLLLLQRIRIKILPPPTTNP